MGGVGVLEGLMTAQIIQFDPYFKRASQKADRAFWIGPEEIALRGLALDILKDDIFHFEDTAPSEYSPKDIA